MNVKATPELITSDKIHESIKYDTSTSHQFLLLRQYVKKFTTVTAFDNMDTTKLFETMQPYLKMLI